MPTRRILAAGFAMAALAPTVARAHRPPGSRGPNGGQVQDIGPYHGELLIGDGELVLFLFDHRDRPMDARRASGSAEVLAAGQRITLPFAPRPDGSALVARGEFPVTADLQVLVQVVPGPGIARARARFTPWR